MRKRWRRGFRSKQSAELNITAFMNLMVILVPFLLITAVFSRITILELNLPPPSNSDKPQEQKLELEVIVRKDGIDVQDRNKGHLRSIPKRKEGYDSAALSEYLQTVKAKFPDVLNASILLERDIPYEILVLVMDTVRAFDVPQEDESFVRAELFPEISIGDAPLKTRKREMMRSAMR